MTEENAIESAFAVLQRADERPLVSSDGDELEALQEYIPESVFSDIWAAYETSLER